MNLFKKIGIALAAAAALSVLGGVLWAKDRYVVPILMYHNVSAVQGPKVLNNVTPEAFAAQMTYIKNNGYKVVGFDEYIKGITQGKSFGRNTVVIHFDDGYDDNYTQAFPVLKQHGFPAMVFLVSDKIGTPGFLTWDQVREMDKAGFAAGAHTRTHAYLPDVPVEQAREEIAGSKAKIESEVGHPIDYFVYPSGGFTLEIIQVVKESGYKAAGTTNRGRDRLNRDLYELNRIRIKTSDRGFSLWAKLSGYYNLFRKPRYSGPEDKVKDYTNEKGSV